MTVCIRTTFGEGSYLKRGELSNSPLSLPKISPETLPFISFLFQTYYYFPFSSSSNLSRSPHPRVVIWEPTRSLQFGLVDLCRLRLEDHTKEDESHYHAVPCCLLAALKTVGRKSSSCLSTTRGPNHCRIKGFHISHILANSWVESG